MKDSSRSPQSAGHGSGRPGRLGGRDRPPGWFAALLGVAIAIIVLVGTPAAYLLATRSFRGRSVVVTLVELPLVLPPAVAGIGLLAAFGNADMLGGALSALDIQLPLHTAAVVVALIFVASPFYTGCPHARAPPES